MGNCNCNCVGNNIVNAGNEVSGSLPKIYTPKATGTLVERDLRDRFADVLNVMDFGAVGDGTTNDTLAIQAAFNAVHEHGAVFFPPNRKFCTRTLLVKRPMTILGGHLYFLSGGLLYDQSETHGGYFFMDETFLESEGTDSDAIGLRLIGAYKNRISNCTFLNFPACGIRVDGGNETNICQCKIRNLNGLGGTGLMYSGSDNLASDLDIQGYYCGIDNGGHNFYTNVHAWTLVPTNAAYTQANLTNSVFMRIRHGRVICTNMYVDTFHIGFKFFGSWYYTNSTFSNIFVISAIGALDGNTGSNDIVSCIFDMSGNDDHDRIEQLLNVNISGLMSHVDSDTNYYQYIRFSNIEDSFYLPNFYSCNNQRCHEFIGSPNFSVTHPARLSALSTYNAWATYSFIDNSDSLRGYLTLRSFDLSSETDNSGNTQLQLIVQANGENPDSAGLYMNTAGSGGFMNLLVDGGHVFPYGESGTIDLGKSDARWNNVFCVTSQASSSDRTIKDEIDIIDDSVLNAWGEIEWLQFKFADAVKMKGENARIHTGAIAQQIQETFDKYGLDVSRYGLFCYDEWDESIEEEVIVDEEAVYDIHVVIDKEAVVEKRVIEDYPSWVDSNGVKHGPILREEERIVKPEESHIEKIIKEPAKTHTVQHIRPAGKIYSIRYVEALCIEAAYQRKRADRLEMRITALEEQINELMSQQNN